MEEKEFKLMWYQLKHHLITCLDNDRRAVQEIEGLAHIGISGDISRECEYLELMSRIELEVILEKEV